MSRIRGCIFDGDGTVMDSMSIWVNAGVRYLSRHGIDYPENLPQELGPLGLDGTISLLRERFRIPGTQDEIFREVWADITNFYYHECPCKPGIKELLADLHRKGVPMLLATAGDLSLLKPAMEREGVFHYFERCISCKEYHTDKNQPLVYRKGAELMGLESSQVAVFEDAPYALRSAKEAGCFTVGLAEPAYASRTFPEMDLWLEDCTDMSRFWALTGL